MRLALYQPDIPQNTGTLLRLCACLAVPLEIIEPCGFTFTTRELKRSVMDYAPLVDVTRHASWEQFLHAFTNQTAQAEVRGSGGRIILISTIAEQGYTDFSFTPDDILLMGSESSGVPLSVHERADHRLIIPMRTEARSLNMAVAAAMVLGEALRQTRSPLPTPAAIDHKQ